MKPWTEIGPIMKCRLCGKEVVESEFWRGRVTTLRGVAYHRTCVEANTRAAQAGGRR